MKTSIALGFGLTLAAASGIAASAMAALPPRPATLITGTALQTTVGTTTQCISGAGLSTFQRGAVTKSSPRPPAIIDVPGFAYQGPSPAAPIYYYGMSVLTFATATAGTIAFDYNLASTKIPSGDSLPFTQYSKSWSPLANTLVVKFKVTFKNCTLPMTLFFRAGPPL